MPNALNAPFAPQAPHALPRVAAAARALLGLLGVLGPLGLLATPAQAQTCTAQSGPQALAVVELYTSEGCSSCPPADRWLSTLKTQDKVLALSFHVNYWNHLGWRDPYATAETTARQHLLKAAMGAQFVYTPQVVANGRDLKNWNGLRASNLAGLPTAAAPALRLRRQGDTVTADISPVPGTQLAGYWAVLQDGLVSKVTRGENAGESLRHDHVVSHYQAVPAWASAQGVNAHLNWPAKDKQRVAFVVTNAALTQPVQALVLQCPS